MSPAPTVLHLGPAHPAEQWLTLVLAVGPFLLLAVVVLLRRRQEAAEAEGADAEEAGDAGDAARVGQPDR